MEKFITLFADLSPLLKLGWMFSCLFFAWMLEAAIPLVFHGYKKIRHVAVNTVFLLSDLAINVLVGLAAVGIFYWIESSSVGLLNLFELPIWSELLIAIIALDLIAQYGTHYLLHKVKWMWKLHMIHHSDTHVDATTGTRHHPGDYFVREMFSLVTIVMFGIPIAYYMFYRFCTIFFTYITHANIQFPNWLDRTLSIIFITPDMHKFHHHFERPWTDSNFGNIFSFWDRIFGTLVYDDPKKVKYGLDVLDGSLDENIGYQLQIPIDKRIKTDY